MIDNSKGEGLLKFSNFLLLVTIAPLFHTHAQTPLSYAQL